MSWGERFKYVHNANALISLFPAGACNAFLPWLHSLFCEPLTWLWFCPAEVLVSIAAVIPFSSSNSKITPWIDALQLPLSHHCVFLILCDSCLHHAVILPSCPVMHVISDAWLVYHISFCMSCDLVLVHVEMIVIFKERVFCVPWFAGELLQTLSVATIV